MKKKNKKIIQVYGLVNLASIRYIVVTCNTRLDRFNLNMNRIFLASGGGRDPIWSMHLDSDDMVHKLGQWWFSFSCLFVFPLWDFKVEFEYFFYILWSGITGTIFYMPNNTPKRYSERYEPLYNQTSKDLIHIIYM